MRTAAVVLPPTIELAPMLVDDETPSREARSVAPGIPGVETGRLAIEIDGSLDILRQQGVRVCGRLLPTGGDAAAIVTVALRTLTGPESVDDAFSTLAVDSLRDDIAERRPYADTRGIELPCGRAVASVVLGEFNLPTQAAGADEQITIPTFRVEFLAPAPEWDGLVVLDVSITDEAAWPEVSQEAVRIARSLRFLDDGEPAREGEHLLRL